MNLFSNPSEMIPFEFLHDLNNTLEIDTGHTFKTYLGSDCKALCSHQLLDGILDLQRMIHKL